MGVVPEKKKIEPVVIHDSQPFNVWPLATMILLIVVICVVLLQHRRSDQIARVAAAENRTFVVDSPAPLFENKVAIPPKLVRTTSIKGGGLPEPPARTPAKAAATPTEDTDTTEDAPVTPPAPAQVEAVQLSNVQLASQNDGAGHEMSVGTATIYNPSPFEITNFDLYVAAGGANYKLEPFAGTYDNPSPIPDRTIPPGGRITVPIMSNGIYTSIDPGAVKVVSVEATENGVTVSNHISVD